MCNAKLPLYLPVLEDLFLRFMKELVWFGVLNSSQCQGARRAIPGKKWRSHKRLMVIANTVCIDYIRIRETRMKRVRYHSQIPLDFYILQGFSIGIPPPGRGTIQLTKATQDSSTLSTPTITGFPLMKREQPLPSLSSSHEEAASHMP